MKLNSDYIRGFYGDTTLIPEMPNAELRAVTYQLRRQWIRIGDYQPGVDPAAERIFSYARELYPKTKGGK